MLCCQVSGTGRGLCNRRVLLYKAVRNHEIFSRLPTTQPARKKGMTGTLNDYFALSVIRTRIVPPA